MQVANPLSFAKGPCPNRVRKMRVADTCPASTTLRHFEPARVSRFGQFDGIIFNSAQTKGGRNVVLFQKAARVAELQLPKDTEVLK